MFSECAIVGDFYGNFMSAVINDLNLVNFTNDTGSRKAGESSRKQEKMIGRDLFMHLPAQIAQLCLVVLSLYFNHHRQHLFYYTLKLNAFII